MEKKKTIQLSALATGTILLGSFSAQPANAITAAYEDLGSGAELRSELLANNNPVKFMNNREVELKCGEGTCGEKSKEDKADKKAKASDEKAADDKAGKKGTQEDRDAAREKAERKEAKKEKKANAADDKAGEAKCGEGKCGN